MPPMNYNGSSSTSTLWATASKEWTIQPKPRPGRKPKKDAMPSNPEGENSQKNDKERRVQNRAAQRAFRERKQSQLMELLARVQSYEQGEVGRNVALQTIAKRLKEENDSLRQENKILKEKISKLDQVTDTVSKTDNKRSRTGSPLCNTVSKRSKACSDFPQFEHSLTVSDVQSPPLMVSSSHTNSPSDSPPLPCDGRADAAHPLFSNFMQISSIMKPTHLEGTGFSPFDCGFCSEGTPCVCQEIVAQQAQAAERMSDYKLSSDYSASSASPESISDPLPLELAPISLRTSILENLPGYQPPVPLRRRPAPSSVNPIFAVAPPPAPRMPAPTCSGDPSNCMACADDSFGKAFCTAIKESIANSVPCDNCLCKQTPPSSLGAPASASCCGDPTDCQHHMLTRAPPSPSYQVVPETMPTNDAWRRIKLHPNVAFADLSLLADVVARRSKCTGPRVVISPAPGSLTPERTRSPEPAHNFLSKNDSVLIANSHTPHEKDEPDTSPRLVPQDVLIRCGRRRVREVQTDAVRNVLHLLDAKFA